MPNELMGLTSRQTHTQSKGTGREAGGWIESRCACQPVSQRVGHPSFQAVIQLVNLLGPRSIAKFV